MRPALKVICIAEFAELGQGNDVVVVVTVVVGVVVAATASNVPGMNEVKCYKGLCKLIIFHQAGTAAAHLKKKRGKETPTRKCNDKNLGATDPL